MDIEKYYHGIRSNKITKSDIINGCQNAVATEKRLQVVHEELHEGICFVENYDKSVTFFGSARFKEDNLYYEKARSIAARVSSELGYAVVTGGGPGIMEAANRGANDAGGNSIGLTIKLPQEQLTNEYVTSEASFHYFFTRKVTLTYSAEAYLYFPGGFGTLDEFFEILTLVQTEKIEKIPIVLVGREFWQPLDSFIKEVLKENHQTIDPTDTDLYHITDNEDEILEIIKNAPVRNGATLEESLSA